MKLIFSAECLFVYVRACKITGQTRKVCRDCMITCVVANRMNWANALETFKTKDLDA